MYFTSFSIAIAFITSAVVAAPSVIQKLDHTGLQSEPAANGKLHPQGLPAAHPGSLGAPANDFVHPKDYVSRAANVTFKHCYILVKDAKSGADMGYVGQRWRTAGWFGLEGHSRIEEEQPLQVRFSYSPLEKTPSRLDSLALNRLGSNAGLESIQERENIRNYPYFGAGAGRSFSENFSPGNFGAVIMGTKSTPPGSPPKRGDSTLSVKGSGATEFESAIWIYDTETKDIRAQWVRHDGSAPETNLVYLTTEDAFVITSEVDKLNAAKTVTFTCVNRPIKRI
ncbi:hypothetical protein BN14_10923 [Rhizoctonia solani AG-1 IB]|uniref:Uncharacterized protein n=1 Tax=Thanatephorus cucumeris (strain AG1-IB / isolate 7/3/14) TaxID=1108050 RepID=M5CBW2_THACB|nr:hypothetical protein BN14_10923 [Rhizoctonia solani AG-1 IB]